MWTQPENDQEELLYLAGERVSPGIYKHIGGNRLIKIEHEDFLPASLDGRVACYSKINNAWHHLDPVA